jgi:DNA-binding NarL/FixJ family response regulator
MNRINSIEMDGYSGIPITLPHLKCLDDVIEEGKKKYQPYVFKEQEVFVKVARPPVFVGGLTIRQRRAYEMHKRGILSEDIARSMKTSSNSVRAMISVARRILENNQNKGESNDG